MLYALLIVVVVVCHCSTTAILYAVWLAGSYALRIIVLYFPADSAAGACLPTAHLCQTAWLLNGRYTYIHVRTYVRYTVEKNKGERKRIITKKGTLLTYFTWLLGKNYGRELEWHTYYTMRRQQQQQQLVIFRDDEHEKSAFAYTTTHLKLCQSVSLVYQSVSQSVSQSRFLQFCGSERVGLRRPDCMVPVSREGRRENERTNS